MSLLGYKFDVQSVLHGQVSLAAVNQICVIHKWLQKTKDSLKACFTKVNISNMNSKCSDELSQVHRIARAVTVHTYTVDI